jgi:redox-sensitive bicupin YhaK (pirin superfamily)
VRVKIIAGSEKDLGAFRIRRLLPSPERRAVGPFVFFDHFGPAAVAPGPGLDVRPHPHIGIATVTYLLEGSFVHRDSLGVVQAITPGAVNWMVAGRGIVHSERTGVQERKTGQRLHGIQTWYALPAGLEECDPVFAHHPKDTLPVVVQGGCEVRVVLGEAFGAVSPVSVPVGTLYAMATLPAGQTLTLDAEHPERAVFVIDGDVAVDGVAVPKHQLAAIEHHGPVDIVGRSAAHIALVGGDPLDGPRHLLWNFVSSDKERLDRAVADWQKRRFPIIPTDAEDFIPYP